MRADQISTRGQAAIYAVLLFASLAYNYSFILIDYIRPFLVRDLHMTLRETALLYAAQASGVIIGSFLVPIFVTRWGCRAILIAASLVFAAFTFGNLIASSFPAWGCLRFGVGIALAASYVSSTTMLANFFPPRVRGRLLAANMAMFSVALLTAGALGALVGDTGWRALIWFAALAPLAVAALATLFLPDDRAFTVYADLDSASDPNIVRGHWREMLDRARTPLTVTCLLLAGLNFSAYQFYSGFITTYLMNVRHFGASVSGSFVIVDGVGTLVGSVFWGWVADRKGRRINAVGLGMAAVFIGLFLISPKNVPLLYALELGYAMCLSATSCWAAYFAELFPVRLRPMGTSLFHGGHIISLLAPSVVAHVAGHYSLALGMALAPVTFLAAAALWWTLPETLRTGIFYRGFTPEVAAA